MPKGKTAVPESFKKKAARDEKLLKSRKANMAAAKKARAEARKVASANAEKYFKEYAAADAKLIKDKRDAKAKGSFFVEGEPKVALLVRIRGVNKLAPKPKKILQLLRLRQINNAVFVKLNKATWNMIRIVEPFITYGYPSRATISKLIYKRGHLKDQNKHRIPLTRTPEDALMCNKLADKGITCVEDIIHEITTCGPHFKEANNFLWPFKLSNPVGGIEIKRHQYAQGYGAQGNREENINNLVQKMW
jgi:large subunit ribosomal protein L7e